MGHVSQPLVRRTRRAYEEFEFHTIYHALHNYCTLDLSAFYLDVLKDRLYASAPAWEPRRSAQTVLRYHLDTLTRIMAPIMVFTAEEIWQNLEDAPVPSVHLATLPEPEGRWEDPELAARWDKLLQIRAEVTRALEAARNRKRIGHPLDAALTLTAPADLMGFLEGYRDDLRSVFIVSQVRLSPEPPDAEAFRSETIPGLTVGVQPSEAPKCPRCWIHDPAVGSFPDDPQVCGRCREALREISVP